MTLHRQTDKANIKDRFKRAKDFILFHQSYSLFLYLGIEHFQMLGKLFLFILLSPAKLVSCMSVVGEA